MSDTDLTWIDLQYISTFKFFFFLMSFSSFQVEIHSDCWEIHLSALVVCSKIKASCLFVVKMNLKSIPVPTDITL